MIHYTITMRHTEDTLLLLSRMQYDLFCTGNRIARSLLSAACVITGFYFSGDNWWGILLIAYGCYLLTSTYSAANHTARKLSSQLLESGCDFPKSSYRFEDNRMRVISLPDKEELESLSYSDIRRMGEDLNYFYLFRDRYGGYMIPKNAIGSDTAAFRRFLTEKTGQAFRNPKFPLQTLLAKLRLIKHNA